MTSKSRNKNNPNIKFRSENINCWIVVEGLFKKHPNKAFSVTIVIIILVFYIFITDSSNIVKIIMSFFLSKTIL